MSTSLQASVTAASVVGVSLGGQSGSASIGKGGLDLPGYGAAEFGTDSVLSFTANSTMTSYDLTFAPLGESIGESITAGKFDFSAVSANVAFTGGSVSATVIGGSGNDSLTAGNQGDWLRGGAGKDTLVSGSGIDTMYGGDGADTFEVGNGDILADYNFAEDKLTDSVLGLTNASVSAGTNYAQVSLTSAVAVSVNAADSVVALRGADGLFLDNKGTSATTLSAYGETVKALEYASDQNDTLIGGNAADSLIGGKGNNAFWGGAGNDSITTGEGNDVVYWGVGEGNDVVRDFATTSDSINLYNANVADLKFATDSTNNAAITLGSGSSKRTLTLQSDKSNEVKLTIKDQTAATQVVDFSAADKTVSLTGNEDVNLFYSAGNGILTAGANVATVNLYDTKYSNFVEAVGSDVLASTLVGSTVASAKSTLKAGTAGAEMWGGSAAADSLAGGIGNDTFYYGLGDGKDTISGYAVANDVLKLYTTADVRTVQFVAEGSNTLVKLGTGNVATLENIDASQNRGISLQAANSAGTVETLWIGGNEMGTTATFADGINSAYYYEGVSGNDQLTFSSEDAQYIWLGNSAMFSNIYTATGGNGADTLIGGAKAGSLTGGSGDNVFWGGSNAAQTMAGGAGDDTYWFGTTDGNDVVVDSSGNNVLHLYDEASTDNLFSGVNFTTKNGTTADKTSVMVTAGSSVLTIQDMGNTASPDNVLTVTDANNKTVNVGIAGNKANATMAYNDAVNLYYATNSNATLAVSGDADLWLGNGWNGASYGNTYFTAATVTNIDASTAAAGSTVIMRGYAGANNTFTGSSIASASTQMWGGGASSDTMVGGASTDVFYFGTGDGKDAITNAGSTDTVKLYADTMANLTSSYSGGKLTITTTAGDTLTLSSFDSALTFQTSDSQTYTYDTTKKEFVKKA